MHLCNNLKMVCWWSIPLGNYPYKFVFRLRSSDRQFDCDFIPRSSQGQAETGDRDEEEDMRVVVRYHKKSLGHFSPFPVWVYNMYDTQVGTDICPFFY